MKIKAVIILLILVSVLGNSHAQTINLSDSLHHVLRHKPIPTAKLDTRNSFITGKSAKVFGIKVGLDFRKTLTVGIGYNWIGTDLTEPVKFGDATLECKIKMRYIAPFIEYSFYKKGPWEATVPVQVGFGRSFHQYKFSGSNEKFNSGRVMLYEPGMTIEYKLLNILGLGGGVGYRIMLKNNKQIDQQFTSPVYVIRVRIIFDELFRHARKWRDGEE